jgi:urease accessory protein
MERDTNRMRGDRPWTFTNLKAGDGLATIIAFLEEKGPLIAPCRRGIITAGR